MTTDKKLTLAGSIAFGYLLGSGPLFALAFITIMSLISGPIVFFFVIILAAATTLPGFVTMWVMRKFEPEFRNLPIVLVSAVAGMSFLCGAMLLTDEPIPGAVELLLLPATALTDVLGDALKGSRGGKLIVICIMAGAGAALATFVRPSTPAQPPPRIFG